MLNLGAIGFASPWFLAALVSLPAIWWLLRVTPPSPREVAFPPLRLLLGLPRQEETPATTPLWLTILRLVLAALVIFAVARPLLNPGAALPGEGTVLIAIDDGWAAAARWPERRQAAGDALDQAERDGRAVALLPTAAPAAGGTARVIGPLRVAEARRIVNAMEPKPWSPDRTAAMAAIDTARESLGRGAATVWLADGLEDGNAVAFAERLQRVGPLSVARDGPMETARAILPPETSPAGFRATVLRPQQAGPETLWVRASGDQGEVLAREPARFEPDKTSAIATLELPLELRNRLARIELETPRSAGGVVLLDERWRRRPVGLVSGSALETAQPLLSDLYYLERALTPFAEVRVGSLSALLERPPTVMALSDIGRIVGPERIALDKWLEAGGVLVRFAGPRLAESADDLIPVRLRAGGRVLEGALSWTQPAKLAPFEEGSPFLGLQVPPDVSVRRQVLAEPSLDLNARTWARLGDGTPLVTAERRGRGWLVLFHTTANTAWSDLPISGLFVDMLKRIVALGSGANQGEEIAASLPPLATLDAIGRLGDPPAAARPVEAKALAATPIGPEHPPGFYGQTETRRALNLTTGMEKLTAMPGVLPGAVRTAYGAQRSVDLVPWLLGLAALLALIDLIAALWLRGLLTARRVAAALLLFLLPSAFADRADAQSAGDRARNDDYALQASLETRLAFVITGNGEVDEMSRAGLFGLTDALLRRTSVEPGDPMGIDIERDELVFFPLLYWPITPQQPQLSEKALAKIDAFMKRGGTILFDTRDGEQGGGGNGNQVLRRLLSRLDVPPLTPVPKDHILTKAFYVMQEFPGRWAGGQVWVEKHQGGSNDGVSGLIIGGNDWAASWAIAEDGTPLAAVTPGGPRQREMAYRFGVNLVMYVLTGNYKADLVHVPALLERLGN
jgi:hypothetical protein